MPYRYPTEKESFDPGRHAKDRSDESYVRKSAIANDLDAQYEADLRYREKSWFEKLFGFKERGVDVAHEEALAEHVKGLNVGRNDLNEPESEITSIAGNFNGVEISVLSNGKEGRIDEDKLTPEEGRFVFNKFLPLLKQREEDKVKNIQRMEKRQRFTEKGGKAIAKLLGHRLKELPEGEAAPRLTGKPDNRALPEHKEEKPK